MLDLRFFHPRSQIPNSTFSLIPALMVRIQNTKYRINKTLNIVIDMFSKISNLLIPEQDNTSDS